MLLRHLHLPVPVPYSHASALQSALVSSLLAHRSSSSSLPPPAPTILTAEFHPVYTCGRREIPHISPSQISHLTAPTPLGRADFHPALRGGQTTFHGPGQLVAYPVLDLRRHGLSAREYVCLLEGSVMDVCAGHGVGTRRTGNPGVWVGEERKICAVGVHLRRHVASHGIGLNVGMGMLPWFGRIVACGLEGKGTTSLEGEGVPGLTVEGVAGEFVRAFGERLGGVDAVVRIGEGEVGGGE